MYRWAIIFVVLSAVGAAACTSKPAGSNTNAAATSNANSDTQNGARTKLEDLSLLISMPYDVQDVTWKQSKDQKKITAVLRFDPDDEKKVVAEAEKFGPAQTVTVDTQSWFPDELTAQSDLHGDQPLTGKAYPANQFFQDPYNTGRIVDIDGTDYYILELTAQ
ncbi:MAG: hypothetical protein JO314_13215 [Acidobacteria bacterium]|nr:hypothetical protein [Acidobacteriota bacterium]